MKNSEEKDPLEEQLKNIIRKKSEENEALNKLLRKLKDNPENEDGDGIPEEENQ
jgi:hypothetical protein